MNLPLGAYDFAPQGERRPNLAIPSLLSELGVEPRGQRRLLLADSRRVDMNYGQAWVTIDGERVVTIVVFGEDDAPALLGAYTLEGLALAVDPTSQRLIPNHLIMYQDRRSLPGRDASQPLHLDSPHAAGSPSSSN